MQAFIPIIIEFLKKYWMYIAGAIGVFVFARYLSIGTTRNIVTEYKTNGTQSISSQLALSYAERLHTAMASTGTDNDEMNRVYNDLKQNPENTKLVYNAFGVRDYGQFGTPLFSWFPSTKADLKQWIKWELSGNDHDKWISLFNSAGIV